MYRPFMSCDDPKGVVECGSIRKYRTNSQKMRKDRTKASGRRPAEDTEESLTNRTDKEDKVSKGSIERTFDSSSLQLMEVSRGAQRLNNMIDSWSRGLSYGGRSEDIAKDLLKGALDLQESLVMLRKVQEASRDVARARRKQSEKPENERIIDDRAHSNRFSEQSNSIGFQRPWPSADGYSSSSREELKKVIKESLVRQNLFPGTSTEALDSASEMHSTSSSQSSMFQNDRLSDSSFSPMNARKEKGPSLVARLMGLEQEEEVTSRLFPTLMQKQLESEKIVNQKRPMFEVDMPKVRKTNPIVHPERHKSKTLREILETNHFNGVLNSPATERKHQMAHYKQLDDLPPIVLIKPRCTPCHEFARVHEPVPSEDLSLRKLKAKPVSSGTFMGKEIEEHVSKRLSKGGRTELLREIMEPEAKEIKPNENEKALRGKVKLNGNVNHKSQESETVDRKVKAKTASKMPPEKAILKHKIVTKSQDQGGEISSTKLRKPQSGSRIDLNDIPGKKSTSLNSISKTKNQKIKSSKEQIKNQMKKQRSTAEPEAAKPVDEQLAQKEEEKTIDVQYKDDCTEIRIIDIIADDLAIEDEVYSSTNKITAEDCNQSQSSSADNIMMLKTEHENGSEADSNKHDNKEEAELKYFLLNNQSFINHAEELLNLDLDCPKMLPKIEADGIVNPRLYLDCANELAERKSLQESQVFHPLLLLTSLGNSRFHISLGSLVEEICIAIRNLSSYSEIQSGKKLASDNIYAMMERDIDSNYGMMNGIWKWGWRHGFSADEAEQVVSEVESLVLSGLIEEVLVNL
ncbi:uncharacterized protein LOC130982031 isoform X1 [Arachis stenosperma]|uniref:uncharacterized protein LOC130982031 isoform X1 n=1 Tax=Arachis stenosperma TaxID=217475 RepID=UPI0025AD5A46|nr:uncharacterized protein LOC130982031 isoform X1 [Arachis stenosperma]XP_057761840.1 uncharacterized protein LOC130982031 isoform X1 [Arachis stenosperma]